MSTLQFIRELNRFDEFSASGSSEETLIYAFSDAACIEDVIVELDEHLYSLDGFKKVSLDRLKTEIHHYNERAKNFI